jgi:hypothetical protein
MTCCRSTFQVIHPSFKLHTFFQVINVVFIVSHFTFPITHYVSQIVIGIIVVSQCPLCPEDWSTGRNKDPPPPPPPPPPPAEFLPPLALVSTQDQVHSRNTVSRGLVNKPEIAKSGKSGKSGNPIPSALLSRFCVSVWGKGEQRHVQLYP